MKLNNEQLGQPQGSAMSRRMDRAFTMMELMVSISILVVIILGVGLTFSGASKSVGVSQATMDMLSNVRSVQQVMEHDVDGLDKNGFLVIRQYVLNGSHYDQISFISIGAFSHRTGTDVSSAPFTDSAVANAAIVWVGQLRLQSANIPGNPIDTSFDSPNQSIKLQQNQAVASNRPTGTGGYPDNGVLGIHRFLLLPGPASGNQIAPAGPFIHAFTSADYGSANVTVPGETSASITSSRVDAVAETPSQVMQEIAAYDNAGQPWFGHFCYRFQALNNVIDTEVNINPFANGYFRTTPIAMQGVSTLEIDWTDGRTAGAGGNLNWYGFGNPVNDASIEAVPAVLAPLGDSYAAVFSYMNKSRWPKALRFSYHVADANNRLKGGRDFVQVIPIPQ